MKKGRVLITGGTGLLGFTTAEKRPHHYEVLVTYHNYNPKEIVKEFPGYHMDLEDKTEIETVLKRTQPDVVVHTAGIGNVDFCEKNVDKSYRVNVEGALNVFRASLKVGARFIFISTNAVFDGNHPPYSEEDVLSPINVYGRHKQEVETEIKRRAKDWVIVRPILMYGWNLLGIRDNAVTWILKTLGRVEKVKVVNDIFCNPLLVDDCAQAIWKIISGKKTGVYHIAGAEVADRYRFAVMTAEVFNLDKRLIKQVPNDYFKTIAPRPRDTSYSINKLLKELGMHPRNLREGLEFMRAHKPKWVQDI